MIFEFIPVAEASIETLMKSINKVVINPIIFFIFALAMVYFLYGVAQYLLNPDNEEVRKTSKSHMMYGIFGLFIMVAVFGIMNLILNTLGERKRIVIKPSGDYEINNNNTKYEFNSVDENNLNSYKPDEVDITSSIDGNVSQSISLTKFDKSPFLIKYTGNPLCWRKEINATAYTKDESIQAVKNLARNTYLKENTVVPDTKNIFYPINFGILTTFDSVNKVYYAWMDARAPIKTGTEDDCVLKSFSERELSLKDYVPGTPFSTPKYMSNGPSPFTRYYVSDSLFVRIVASGVNSALQLARDIAVKNAFALLDIEVRDVNMMTIIYPTARILEEKYERNPATGNYEYWVAVESKRISDPVKEGIKASPFTKLYESDSTFARSVNFAISKSLSTARDLAISNTIADYIKKVDPNNAYKGIQLVVILEEKQVYNEKTGEYEYWVAIEGSNSREVSKPSGESIKVAPFTKIYKTDSSKYRIVSSGISKDLDTAKNIAISNGLIKLKDEIGTSLTGTRAVVIVEEKQTINSVTGNYEYWIALEVSK